MDNQSASTWWVQLVCPKCKAFWGMRVWHGASIICPQCRHYDGEVRLAPAVEEESDG